MTLYEIDQAILDCIDQETGEIIDTEKLDALEMEREQKISNVACWVKDLKAEAEAIKAEKQNLDKRQKAAENKAEQLKEYLKYALGGNKFKDARSSISYRRSESVMVADVETLPDEFIRVKKEAKLTELKEAIKGGQQFDGVEIVEKQSIQIR